MLANSIISAMCVADPQVSEMFENATRRKKYTYSRASILNTDIDIEKIEGKEYKGFIHPSILGGIDSSLEQEIKVNVTTIYFEIHTI